LFKYWNSFGDIPLTSYDLVLEIWSTYPMYLQYGNKQFQLSTS
jgi:hypothetical protein